MIPPGSGKRVLCTGRLYCDVVMSGLSGTPVAGQEVYASSMIMAAGGGAYITAAYLAAMGRGVGLASVIPAEPFAGKIAEELAASGIALDACVYAPIGADPQITIAMITGGDRAFVTRRSGPAIPDTVPAQIASGQYAHLHIGELASLADMPQVVALAKAAGMSISVDCAWDAEILARDDLVNLLRGVDVFLPNRAEAEALARHAAVADYAGLVVVKNGRDGAEALTGGTITARPALNVDVVDTVGAGDAFNAGFLDSWLEGCALPQCLDAGAYVASVALARSGGARGLDRLEKDRTAAE
ncbi:carbohydrate kinase family protein [Pseudorhodobacter sp. W20_MBD10_FR17]|uniref:carbohydrate kinase family protein n=1 Tax=Pseudorhodobacter sp. W20_MBD10_FR17 TaxID=3240266 RepID=UPI003F9A201F